MRTPISLRRTTRHALRGRGQAVDADTFSLLGDKFLDASGEGCLLACDAEAKVGQRVFLTFENPETGRWFDAEAEIVRVIDGFRDGDPGYCAGLRYVEFDRKDQLELIVDLRSYGMVPAARPPARRLKALYAAAHR